MKRCLVVLAMLCVAQFSYSQTCPGPLSVTITGSSSLNPLTADGTATDSQCASASGDLSGAIDVTVEGGSPDYIYVWEFGGAPFGGNTQDLSGLGAGNYAVTITDAEGCFAELTFVIAEPDPVDVSGTPTQPLCNVGSGDLTGSISVTASGGFGPYEFAWTSPNGYAATNNDASGDLIENLGGGVYTVVVTDDNGCTDSAEFTLIEPDAIVASIAPVDLDCNSANGAPDGELVASATGGTNTYSYLWTGPGITSGNETSASLTGLVAGAYTVVVTDGAGCTDEESYTLTQPDPITVLAVSEDLSCNSISGLPDGSITTTPAGGTAPYNFNWSTGDQDANAATSTISDLAAGTYQITIVDSNGCTYEATYTLTQPTPVSATYTFVDPACAAASGLPTGSITMTNTTGGTEAGTYDYLWSTGETTASLTNLAEGTYTVTVTDDNDCTYEETFVLAEPEAVTCSVDPDVDGNCGNNISCNGGTADVTVTAGGGTGVYTYSSNGTDFQASNIFNLAAGTYTITTQDDAGCESTCTVTLTEPDPLVGATCVEDDECQVGDGEIKVEALGGCAPYTVSWSAAGAGTLNVATQTIATDGGDVTFTGALGGETYTFTIIDANGCQIGG